MTFLVSATTLYCISIIIEKVKNEDKCSSCVLYIVLFSTFFTISIGVYFVYYKCINHNKENVSKYDYIYQAKNY